MYAWTSPLISLLGRPLRPVKNAFTSGWLKRYVDVFEETPDATLARSAAVQSAGGSANAVGAVPTSMAPVIAPAPNTPATAPRAARESNISWLLRHPVEKRQPGAGLINIKKLSRLNRYF